MRIMPVGDSITHGTVGDHTWRWFLDRHLRAEHVEFDLVGPRRTLWSPEGPVGPELHADPDFASAHAGWWGDSLVVPQAEGPDELVRDHDPDVVVLALGTNDLGFWQQGVTATVGRVRTWVARARQQRRDLDVVLVGVPGTDQLHQQYAVALTQLAAELTGELTGGAARTVCAPWPEDYVTTPEPEDDLDGDPEDDPAGDTWDEVHPNARGQAKIAAQVADALALLGVGRPYPRPLAFVPEGPAVVPAVTTEPLGPGALVLHWQVPPGADSADVWHRVGRAGEWTRLARAVTGGELTVQATRPGVEHTFRVRLRRTRTLADPAYAGETRHRWDAAVASG